MTDLANDITTEITQLTLADMVESYLQERMIFNEKYYASYLKFAANAWAEIFHDTLYVYNGRWLPVKQLTNGQYFIKFPKDCNGFISANILDHCQFVKRIPYNSDVNVIQKPSSVTVSCQSMVSSMVTTTQYLFTSGGVDYYQKQYLEYCPNGDIIERTVTPVKQYLDFNGDTAGDYNPDYNGDYSRPVFGNFQIINNTEQRILVNLDTDENGCPLDTIENVNKLVTYCGCYSHYAQNCLTDYPVFNSLKIGEYGCVTLTEDRRGLIYTPPTTFSHCFKGSIPDYIMVYFKGNSSGNEVTGAAIIPDDFYVKNALTLGTDYYSVRLNRTISEREKPMYRARFDEAINNLVRNRLFFNTDVLTKVSELKRRW